MATDILVADQKQTESSSSLNSSSTATISTSDLNNNTNNSNVNENTNNANVNEEQGVVGRSGGANDASGEWAVVYNQKEKHRLKQTKQQQQDCKSATNDKQKQQETPTTGLKKSQSHQLNLRSDIGNESATQAKQNANPWAKLPQLVVIQQNEESTQQSTQTKKDHQLNTSSTSQSSSSSFNPNTSTSSSSSIQPSNNTTNTSSNLDYMDWPSLSDLNCSTNNTSSQTINKKNAGITQSKSSIELNDMRNNKKTTMNSRKFKSQSSFNENDEISGGDGDGDGDDGIYEDEYDNDNNNNNNNTKTSINGEINETTTSSSSTSGSGGSNNCSSDESKENNNNNNDNNNKQQTKQQTKKKQKWKPLIIEAGKRERKSYRSTTTQPHLSPSSTKTNNKDRVKSMDRISSSNNINGTTTTTTTTTDTIAYNTPTTRNDYYYNNSQQYSTTTTTQPHIPHSSTTYSGFYKYNTKKYPKSESTRSFRHYATTTATTNNYKMSTSRSDYIHDTYKDNYIYNDDTTQIILKDIVDSHCNIAATPYPTATTTTAVLPPPPPPQPYILVDYNNQFEILKELIKNQIEYYFSDENLNGDIYLRRKMDANGYIEIALICLFNRVKSLSQDQQLIIDSIQSSDQLEISDDYLRVRRRNDPLKWPLPSLLQTLNPDVPEFVPKFMSQQKSNNDQESVHINAELDRLLSTTSEPENELLIGNKQQQNTRQHKQQRQNDNYNRFAAAAAAATSANLSSLSLH